MKKIFMAYAWMLLTVGVILTSVAGYQTLILPKLVLPNQSGQQTVLGSSTQSFLSAEAAQNSNGHGVESVVATQDARAALVATFLERYRSPLEPYDYYGTLFVNLADKYNFDFRLLPAIAMQESNLCKSIPANSFNCLGFGIHERGTLEFESFEANFERAAKELKANYIDRGLTTPEDIMTKYTPSSDGSWAASVNQWMTEIRYNDRELGRQIDQNSSVLEFVGN